MAEAVGTAAAVIELTSFAFKIGKTINQFKNAPKEIVALQSQLDLFQTLARRLQALTDSNLTLETDLAVALQTVERSLKDLDDFIDSLKKDPALLRAKWVLRRDEAARKVERFRGSLGTLGTFVEIFQV